MPNRARSGTRHGTRESPSQEVAYFSFFSTRSRSPAATLSARPARACVSVRRNGVTGIPRGERAGGGTARGAVMSR